MATTEVHRMLRRFLEFCDSQLGDAAKKEIKWYETQRPKRVSAYTFFEAYAWALLVSGISRKSAETWTSRTGFWEVFTLENCHRYPSSHLVRRVGVVPENKMGKKLSAIHTLGRVVFGLKPREVAARYFGGEVQSERLGEPHVGALVQELRFIRETSAKFMIRNMGGELIKNDRWLQAIMGYFRCDEADLQRAGARLGWQLGKIDLVLYLYCEQYIKTTNRLRRHLHALGCTPRVHASTRHD